MKNHIKTGILSLLLFAPAVMAAAPCPSQSCKLTDDILANKHFRAKDHYYHNGNGETNYYLSSRVSSVPGLLTLSTVKATGSQDKCGGPVCQYDSGWVDTQGVWSTAGINHGYVEVSATMPVSPNGQNQERYRGMWPAIWMLPNNVGAGWPVHGEIDISELHGIDAMSSGATLHWNNVPGSTAYADGTLVPNPAIAHPTSSYGSTYHTFGLEWNFTDSNHPYLATWYDGVQIVKHDLHVQDTKTKAPQVWLDKDVFGAGQVSGGYYLILNIATGGAFGPTGPQTSDGSNKDANNPLLQMKINSIKSWSLD